MENNKCHLECSLSTWVHERQPVSIFSLICFQDFLDAVKNELEKNFIIFREKTKMASQKNEMKIENLITKNHNKYFIEALWKTFNEIYFSYNDFQFRRSFVPFTIIINVFSIIPFLYHPVLISQIP